MVPVGGVVELFLALLRCDLLESSGDLTCVRASHHLGCSQCSCEHSKCVLQVTMLVGSPGRVKSERKKKN